MIQSSVWNLKLRRIAPLILFGGVICSTTSGRCAEIIVDHRLNTDTVSVIGKLEINDVAKFQTKTSHLSQATVVFDSEGGSAVAGIRIGEIIRLRNFSTAVVSESVCASACALAWLGGTRRFMAARAKIGFHAAYTIEKGQATEKGVANAVIGAYLNKISLPYSAVIYITETPPQSMAWLNIAEAQKRGIDVSVFNETPHVATRVWTHNLIQ